MDVYVVIAVQTNEILGISARLQGAELLRSEYESVNPDGCFRIQNHEVQDVD